MAVLEVFLMLSGFLGCTLYVFNYCRDRNESLNALYALVFLCWLTSLVFFALLPIDLATALEKDRNASEDSIDRMRYYCAVWRVLYAVSFLMSWFVLPICLEYCVNGEFEFRARMFASMRLFLIQCMKKGTFAMLCVAYISVIINGFSIRNIVSAAITITNIYSSTWVMIILIDGLVKLPYTLWKLRTADVRMKSLYENAVYVHNELVEADFEYEEVAEQIHTMIQQFLAFENVSIILTRQMQEIKDKLNTILSTHDRFVRKRMKYQQLNGECESQRTYCKIDANAACPARSEIVNLHSRLKKVSFDVLKWEQAWIDLCAKASCIESNWNLSLNDQATLTHLSNWPQKALYHLMLQIKSQVTFCLVVSLCILSSFLSAVILWSEMTMGFPTRSTSLSLRLLDYLIPVSLSLKDAVIRVELASFVLYSYICICLISSFYKVGTLGKYSLHGHRNIRSMLQTSVYQCRLQFALANNFLLLFKDAKWTHQTGFIEFFHEKRALQSVGYSFALYSPILIMALYLMHFTGIYGRALQCLGLELVQMCADDRGSCLSWFLFKNGTEMQSKMERGQVLLSKGLDKYRSEIYRRRRKADTNWSSVDASSSEALLQ